MGFLKRALRLSIQTLATAIVVRWALRRLRRVLLLPTANTTPPIGPGEVTPRLRRLIVSDIHMGAGDRLDDFDDDAKLAAFFRFYATTDEPTELILAGDTFEFLQVRLPGLGDYEWSGAAAVQRLQAILSAHSEPIAALREFVARPHNQLTLLIGNHDFELHYAEAKQLFRQAIGLDPSDERLRFGITYAGGGIYLEHGNQFDPWNHFVHFEGVTRPFEVVRGTRVVKDVINPLEDDPLSVAPLIDNVKPISAFFWYMLSLPRLRQLNARRYVIRGLLRLFRTVALLPVYHRHPVLEVREELLGPPGQTLQRKLALQAIYEADAELREAVAANYGGVAPEVQSGRREALLAQKFARQIHNPMTSEAVLEQIEQEAGRQLRREIRAFKDDILQAMANVAASPDHGHHSLYVCGHTHLAQIVPLSEWQTYVNIGTWTEVVLDIANNRCEEQRSPFLEVRYPAGSAAPEAQLLVWRGVGLDPQPWVAEQEVAEEL